MKLKKALFGDNQYMQPVLFLLPGTKREKGFMSPEDFGFLAGRLRPIRSIYISI